MDSLTCMQLSGFNDDHSYIFLKQLKINRTLVLEIRIKSNGEFTVFKNNLNKSIPNSIKSLRNVNCVPCEARDAFREISKIWEDLKSSLEDAIW